MGKVSETVKAKVLGESWVMLQPSMIEGWGITVIEANASGTPVIASDVSGLRDSIIHDKTGVLVAPGNVNEFALAMSHFITDEKYRTLLTKNALNWSQKFTWDRSADAFYKIISAVVLEKSQVVLRKNISLAAK